MLLFVLTCVVLAQCGQSLKFSTTFNYSRMETVNLPSRPYLIDLKRRINNLSLWTFTDSLPGWKIYIVEKKSKRNMFAKLYSENKNENEFRESEKSLKHEWRSIYRSCLSQVSCWCCGSILVSYTGGGRFEPF